MYPFPHIILELRCPPNLHDSYMQDTSVTFPTHEWTGPREVICLKRGKLGKKYLFNSINLDKSSKLFPALALNSALASLEAVRKAILPNTVGLPESASIKLLLAPNSPLSVWLEPTTLARIASFGMRLDVATPELTPSPSERAAILAEAKQLGIEALLTREPDDLES
jgi:hypothetical protein